MTLASYEQIEQSVARMLVDWPTDSAPRTVIRSKLPKGDILWGTAHRHSARMKHGQTGSRNQVTRIYQTALFRLEKKGAIRRTPETVTILDRALLEQIAKGQGPPWAD